MPTDDSASNPDHDSTGRNDRHRTIWYDVGMICVLITLLFTTYQAGWLGSQQAAAVEPRTPNPARIESPTNLVSAVTTDMAVTAASDDSTSPVRSGWIAWSKSAN